MINVKWRGGGGVRVLLVIYLPLDRTCAMSQITDLISLPFAGPARSSAWVGGWVGG